MTDYLTLHDVLAMHADQIERYGGSSGIRDPGQLEAALFRPQTGHSGLQVRGTGRLVAFERCQMTHLDGRAGVNFAHERRVDAA